MTNLNKYRIEVISLSGMGNPRTVEVSVSALIPRISGNWLTYGEGPITHYKQLGPEVLEVKITYSVHGWKRTPRGYYVEDTV